MPTEKKILTFAVDDKLFRAIEDFRFGNRINTMSQAIRRLILRGLKEFENRVDIKESGKLPTREEEDSLHPKKRPIEYGNSGMVKRRVKIIGDTKD